MAMQSSNTMNTTQSIETGSANVPSTNLGYPPVQDKVTNIDSGMSVGYTLVPTTLTMTTSSVKAATSERTPSMSALGLIKCPTYCRSNCIIQHHPLLVAILNCLDTEQMDLMDMKLGILKNVISKYQYNMNWNSNDVIPDVVEYYRYPMIHWACTLGRVAAAVWLVGHAISDPTTRALSRKSETGLHRALMCLQETCPNCAGHKFVQLLSVMEPALSVADKDGNTPIHLCSEMLRINIPRSDFYSQALFNMLMEIKKARTRDAEIIAEVLNIQNNDGDTALHLLSENGKHMAHIKLMVKMGANPLIANKTGITAVKIAQSRRIYNLLNFYIYSTEGIRLSVEAHCVTSDAVLPSNTPAILTTSIQGASIKAASQHRLTSRAVMPPAAVTPVDSHVATSFVPTVVTELNETVVEPVPKKIKGYHEISRDQELNQVTNLHDLDANLANVVFEVMSTESQLHSDKTSEVATDSEWLAAGVMEKTTSALNIGDIQISPTSSTVDSSNTSTDPSSPMMLFEGASIDDVAAQKYFEETINSADELKVKPKPFSREVEFMELVNSFGSKKNAPLLKLTLTSMPLQTILEYLVKMKDLNLHCDLVKHILSLRDKELTNLRHSYRSIAGLKRKFRETQKQQDKQVSEIMGIVDGLGQLQQEEQTLVAEIDVIKKQNESADQSRSSLQERLQHCNQAIDVLKQLQKEDRMK